MSKRTTSKAKAKAEAEAEQFRVSVYYDTDDESTKVKEVLERVSPGHTYVYNGVIDGWATSRELSELRGAGNTVVVTGTPPPQPTPPVGSAPAPSAGAGSGGLRVDPASVPPAPSPTTLLRRSELTDPILSEQIQKLEERLPKEDATVPPVYQIRLKEQMRPEWQKQLEALGKIESITAPNLCYVSLTEDGFEKVRALPFVRDVRRYGIAEKVTPDLLDSLKFTEQAAEAADGPQLMADAGAGNPSPQTYEVIVQAPQDLAQVKEAIAGGTNAKIIGESATAVRFRVDPDVAFLAKLAALPGVGSLSTYQPPKLFCDHARCLVGLDAINRGETSSRSKLGRWTGRGELVGIFDSGIDATHPDLKDRIEKCVAIEGASATDRVGHGTHVAGIIAGTGRSSGKGRPLRGMAPDARLVVVGVTDDQGTLQIDRFVDLGDLLKLATDAGAKIINLSWGDPIGGSYNHGSLSVDQFVCEHPDVLIVVAAGNAGAEDPATGDLCFNTIGAPATAKNVLTVGASATDRTESDFQQTWAQFRPAKFKHPPAITTLVAGDPDVPAVNSSRGPTDFDSVKPDVLAPGTFILATRSSQAPAQSLVFWKDYKTKRYVYIGGTSMAAPIVAGCAAVVRQYLREECGCVNPSAALLKAVLMASTKQLPAVKPPDLTEVIGYPDFDQGFGRIDLANILPHPAAPSGRRLSFIDIPNDSADALESRAPIGGTRKSVRTYTVKLAAGATDPLRVVLAWTDPPGNAVQNNLQVEVQGPQGHFVGNPHHRYRRDPNFDDRSEEGVPFDKRNNVEQVRIEGEQLQEGQYRVRVIAQNTSCPPQGFALCVCGELESELAPA